MNPVAYHHHRGAVHTILFLWAACQSSELYAILQRHPSGVLHSVARIFISHSSKDHDLAAHLLGWLREQGFDQVFLDFEANHGIKPGANWEKTLYREIARADAILIVHTPNWQQSKWCFAEFAQARALGKAIFTLVETPPSDDVAGSDIQHIDLVADRPAGLNRLRAALVETVLAAQSGFPWDGTRAPYPGLLAFEEQDAAVYFGRDDDIRRLIERMNARRSQGGPKLITLLGASGSGKSSLLRAGVLPRVKRDQHNWIVLPPFRPRLRPVDELAQALAIALRQPEAWRAIRDRLADPQHAAAALDDLARDLRAASSANEASVLVTIDQAEELFVSSDPAQASQLFSLLTAALAEHQPFLAVLALRPDYLGRLQQAPGLSAQSEEFSLKPFAMSRVADVIRGPARIANFSVDDDFIALATRTRGPTTRSPCSLSRSARSTSGTANAIDGPEQSTKPSLQAPTA